MHEYANPHLACYVLPALLSVEVSDVSRFRSHYDRDGNYKGYSTDERPARRLADIEPGGEGPLSMIVGWIAWLLLGTGVLEHCMTGGCEFFVYGVIATVIAFLLMTLGV